MGRCLVATSSWTLSRGFFELVATDLRNLENNAFNNNEADLTESIKQMKTAFETLSAGGADQTKSTGADNKQFIKLAPFIGIYTSQSALVMGIIKSVRDTCKANLADARKTEMNSAEA